MTKNKYGKVFSVRIKAPESKFPEIKRELEKIKKKYEGDKYENR